MKRCIQRLLMALFCMLVLLPHSTFAQPQFGELASACKQTQREHVFAYNSTIASLGVNVTVASNQTTAEVDYRVLKDMCTNPLAIAHCHLGDMRSAYVPSYNHFEDGSDIGMAVHLEAVCAHVRGDSPFPRIRHYIVLVDAGMILEYVLPNAVVEHARRVGAGMSTRVRRVGRKSHIRDTQLLRAQVARIQELRTMKLGALAGVGFYMEHGSLLNHGGDLPWRANTEWYGTHFRIRAWQLISD